MRLQAIKHYKENDSVPFTLNDVQGLFVLDSAPDYTEIERTFLQQIEVYGQYINCASRVPFDLVIMVHICLRVIGNT